MDDTVDIKEILDALSWERECIRRCESMNLGFWPEQRCDRRDRMLCRIGIAEKWSMGCTCYCHTYPERED